MSELLFHYRKVDPMTWVYFSSLLSVALYFKFSRLWSVRNLDLICLILLAPGLVLEVYGREQRNPLVEQAGYMWLFAIGGLFLIRLLLDPTMVRRPLLEPNLSVGGMTFLGVSLLLFLMANVAISNPAELVPGGPDISARQPASHVNATPEKPGAEAEIPGLARHGPRYPLLRYLPAIPTQTFFGGDHKSTTGPGGERNDPQFLAAARTIIILSHLAVVIGVVLIGYRHFDNIKTGVAAAVLYLLLPYTAEMTGRPDHVLPAALLVWAIALYRQPMVSGLFVGLAVGVIYYPLFLLPLWISFYWQRGLVRFCTGVVLTVGILIGVLALSAPNFDLFFQDLRQMLGLALPTRENLEGFWGIPWISPEYRLPVLALFVALAGSFALWPAQKNLGTLMSCTAALMLGAQFWHGHGGGLYMAWYLPLLLLTIFRPNLEDRVALSVLGEGWLPRRNAQSARAEKAA
jgi:hypothetical protein